MKRMVWWLTMFLVGYTASCLLRSPTLALHRASQRPESDSVKERNKRRVDRGSIPTDQSNAPPPSPNDDAIRMRLELIGQLEYSLSTLESKVSTPDAIASKARKLLRMYLATNSLNTPYEYTLSIGAQLGECNEEMTPIFVQEYARLSKLSGNDPRRLACMDLILRSGGEHAGQYVKGILGSTELQSLDRNNLLQALDPSNGPWSVSRLRIDDETKGQAMTLCQSQNPLERRGGAALLGACKDGSPRSLLRSMITSDSDRRVRMSAAWSLAHCGDATDLQLFESIITSLHGQKDLEARRFAAWIRLCRAEALTRSPSE